MITLNEHLTKVECMQALRGKISGRDSTISEDTATETSSLATDDDADLSGKP